MKRRTTLIALILATCAGCSAPSPQAAPRRDDPLAAFHQALDSLQSGHPAGPVRVIQIGDSHTANDGFSTRMREQFQARFGDAGRGTLPPGIPFRTYNPGQVSVTATGWQTYSSLDAAASGPFGIAGVRMHASGPAEMTLRGDEPGRLGLVWVEALGQPGGGTLDAEWQSGARASFPTGGAGSLWLPMPAGAGAFTLRARGDGPVDVLSWTAQRTRPGVTWSNLGTIGATVDLIGRWDPALMAAEMARLHPALILVAFGTNEGFSSLTDPALYEANYAGRLDAIEHAAPWASIVVMGPPDGVRRVPRDTPPGETVCNVPTPGPTDPDTWSQPPHLAEVRAAQIRVARAKGAYFWDWAAAMGGPCSMVRWARLDPPRAQPDHVHLFRLGYRATADRLFADLMADYARHQASPGR